MKKLLIICVAVLLFGGATATSAIALTYGGHNTAGATSPSTTWYFAEGYTGEKFDEWLCLQNPGSVAANVTITYMFREGENQTTSKNISANSRETISVNSDAGANKEVSIKVEADGQIVAERSMYFNYQNKWPGGHNTLGTTTPANTWYFAEGYTGSGFEEWLTLQNPGATDATVTITYMFRQGETLVRTKTVAANSRETVDVNTDAGADKEVSIKIESTQPLVAEKPIYFEYQGMDPSSTFNSSGGHNTIGVTSASNSWYFAEGYTDLLFDNWLTLQNPGATDATATITYYLRGDGTQTNSRTVAANSRETVYINQDVGTGKEVSIEIQSTQPLVAERPIYFAMEDFSDGGHNTIGVTAAQTSWYFAEGYTGDGFREWLTLQNPNATSANITITYMYRDGDTKTVGRNIPAYSRETVNVNTDVGANKEVSLKVESDNAIIAERPMYFYYQDSWDPASPTHPTVFVTDTGTKYHNDGCRHLKASKHAISLSEAKSQGYSPCGTCNPPH